MRWWPLHAFLVYVCLIGFTWIFHQDGAHAAQRRLRTSSFDDSGSLRSFRRPRRTSGSRKKATYQKIKRVQGGYSLQYGFRNFNKDRLSMKAFLSADAVAESIREFGFRKSDLDAIDKWYMRAQKNAIAGAKKKMFSGNVSAKTQAELNRKMARINASNKRIQKQLDRTLDNLAKRYRQKRLNLYKKAGFRYKKKGVIEVDIPALIKSNWRRVRPVAQSFAKVAAKKGYGSEELVGAVTAMIQTSIRYEIPGDKEGSRVVAGVLPPLKTLVLGQGDCDTKSALLGSILANWPNIKMVGLGIPGHYLMAVHRIPRRGDVFIEHEGIPYVMIESAGPAWLSPGTVGDSTMDYLNAGKEFRIQKIM